ncbi:hypothetical protein DM860_013549 [Cuscuta australis]|uniref:Putative zinc-finger domain-containing protein n=1 Tax=Cuscuta australis TaxID=267555 RepID=A0A328EE60_9ASTE|nr:hypothetical protein DM860_013549 [Cuscuta australis]
MMDHTKALDGKQTAATEAVSGRRRRSSMENPSNSEAEQRRSSPLPDKKISSSSREEGELSDDDENQPHCSTSQFPGVNAAKQKAMETELVKETHGNEAGRRVSSNTLDRLSSRPSQESNAQKNSDKNRGSFVPFLISFSDDESGSDPEGTPQKNVMTKESRSLSVNTSKKPPQASVRKPQKTGKPMRNESKVARTMPLTHKILSSSHNINATTHRRGGSSLNVRSYNNFKKTAGPSFVHKTNTTLDNSKLQDLRQLIAIRENELKLKSTQQPKNFSSTKCNTLSTTGTCISVTGVSGATGAENMPHEVKEPSRKIQRIGEKHSSQMVQNVHTTDTVFAPEKPVLANCGQPGVGGQNSHNKVFRAGTSDASLTLCHNENENQGSTFLTNFDAGTDLITGQSCWKTNPRDHVATLEQSAVNESIEVEMNDPTKHSEQSIYRPGYVGKNFTGRGCSFQIGSVQPAAQNVNQESLNIQQVPHNFREANISRNSSMNMQSLLDIEELHDKQLEEAQEYRHKCEIEERIALKAYRKAQKALIEANYRCSALFRKREKYSTQLQHFMIENPVYPDMFFPPGSQLESGAGLNLSTNNGANAHLMLSSCYPAQHEDRHDHQMRDVEFHSTFDAVQNASDMPADRENLAFDHFSEPDVSMAEITKVNQKANGVCLQPDYVSMSAEEENGLFQKSPLNSSEYLGEEAYRVTQEKEANNSPGRHTLINTSQDSMLLEASLRSQLFERLKMKSLSKEVDKNQNVEQITESMLNVDDVEQRMGMSSGNMLSSDAEKANEKDSDFQVSSDKAELEYEAHVEINDHCNSEKFGSNFHPILSNDHLSSCMSIDDQQSQSPSFATFSLPAFRSAFSHFKGYDANNFGKLQTKSVNMQASHLNEAKDEETMETILGVEEYASLDLHYNKNGSYACKFSIDPIWPLCMYELRGKCNDKECTWQHFRDYSSENKLNPTCNNRDVKDGSAIERGKFLSNNALTMSHDSQLLAPPIAGFDVIKSNSQTCKSVVPQRKCFSGFLVLSSLLLTDLVCKEPFLYGSEVCVEVHGGWSRQLLYFQNRNGTSIEGGHQVSDNDQSIEFALLSLCQEVNKSKGRMEALKVLARALEADPTSALLWIVYLLVYYSNQKYIGKDDMFKHAVQLSNCFNAKDFHYTIYICVFYLCEKFIYSLSLKNFRTMWFPFLVCP